MTNDQYEKLKPGNILQYSDEQYKLIVKDPLGKWIAEVIDKDNIAYGFSVLKFSETIVEQLRIVA